MPHPLHWLLEVYLHSHPPRRPQKKVGFSGALKNLRTNRVGVVRMSGAKCVPMKSAKVPDPPPIRKLSHVVGNIHPEEIKPLWKIRKYGYEYFWVKMFSAWSWRIGHDLGKIFMIGTTHFHYFQISRPARCGPAVPARIKPRLLAQEKLLEGHRGNADPPSQALTLDRRSHSVEGLTRFESLAYGQKWRLC